MFREGDAATHVSEGVTDIVVCGNGNTFGHGVWSRKSRFSPHCYASFGKVSKHEYRAILRNEPQMQMKGQLKVVPIANLCAQHTTVVHVQFFV